MDLDALVAAKRSENAARSKRLELERTAVRMGLCPDCGGDVQIVKTRLNKLCMHLGGKYKLFCTSCYATYSNFTAGV